MSVERVKDTAYYGRIETRADRLFSSTMAKMSDWKKRFMPW